MTQIQTKVWAPRPAPFKPKAIDADNDGIVQEGTIWERPAGANFVDAAGNLLDALLTALPSGAQMVDAKGSPIKEYTPKALRGKPPTAAAPKQGFRANTLGGMNGTLGTRHGTLESRHGTLESMRGTIGDQRTVVGDITRSPDTPSTTELDAPKSGLVVPDWAEGGATPADVLKGGVFYHASDDEALEIHSSGWGGNLHVGTLSAAADRAGIRRVDDRGTLTDSYVHEFEVTPKNPYLPGGKILREDGKGYLEMGLTSPSEIGKIIDDPDRQAELLAEGYDVIPYINKIEQPESVSYIILDPDALTSTGATGKATQTDDYSQEGVRDVRGGRGILLDADAFRNRSLPRNRDTATLAVAT